MRNQVLISQRKAARAERGWRNHREMRLKLGAKTLCAAVLAVSTVLPAWQTADAAAPTPAAVIETYANIAQAAYADALAGAENLKRNIGALLQRPNEENLRAAREAWRAARVPYMQTEVYRFGNKAVDDWEKKVNAWPLDEGLIDYVAEAYGSDSPENELYAANVIASRSIKIGGRTVNTSKLTRDLLRKVLHEAGGIEANVAMGYHAVEFLLWGQDLNGTGAGSGQRPASDYDLKNCTGGNCVRRAQYLRVVTDLLVDDLKWMAAQWRGNGRVRQGLRRGGDVAGLTAIFTGLGSLSYGELAGERMKLGLMLHDTEEEHDCFSDNTHNSHYFNAVGMRNVYLGRYTRTDGSVVAGPSVSDLVRAKSPEIDDRVRAALEQSITRLTDLMKRAETIEAYDQMIAEGNAEGNAMVERAIEALIAQAKEFERAIAALELKDVKFEGSKSLDEPQAVTGKK
jgi:putative iron-regulated protein